MVSSVQDRDVASADVATLPLAPTNPLPLWRRCTAARAFTPAGTLRDAGGPVTRVILGPKRHCLRWLSSPHRRARGTCWAAPMRSPNRETPMATELRRLMGGNLLVLAHDEWLPRRRAVQPLFTKKHVQGFGGHMAQAAEQVSGEWGGRGEIDLDAHLNPPRTRTNLGGASRRLHARPAHSIPRLTGRHATLRVRRDTRLGGCRTGRAGRPGARRRG